MIGQTLGHYRILSKLGEGGMGVVYSARDAHLDRRVAIKVLPAQAVANPERKRRFVQEAKAASALSHPNIITIYDISQADGVDFIAMEYVSGKTLEDLIRPKGLALGEALKYAVQIADALASAHAAGIVHRDLKPANIMVNEKGLVKVLDFGLAKLTEPKESDELTSTLTKIDESPRTEMGTVLGTVAYMSPEQAEGRPVDARSDIFSFGSVLYEMLTGRRAFCGNNKLSVMTAIVRDEPERVSALAPVVPVELESLIARLLRKDPERRWQSMADVKVALTEIKEESSTGGGITSKAPADSSVPSGSFLKRRRALAGTIIGTAALLLMGAAWFVRNHFFQPQKPDLGELTWVLISKFDNRTGEPVFDGTLEYALERELSNSSFVNVAPRERVEDALRLMKKSLNASIDANLGREICLRDGGIRVLLGGRVEKLGSTYSLSVLLVDPTGGATIASVNDEAPGQQQVLAVMRRLSNNVRAALGEALPAIRESNEKLEKVTTPSLRALQLYTEAMALINERKWGPAAELLKSAISTDPEFASANIYCAWALRNQGSPREQWLPYRERAFQLAGASSDVERYFILGSYYSILRQDEQSIAPYQALLRLRPEHDWGISNLIQAYRRLGRVQESVPYILRRAQLRPNDFNVNHAAAAALALRQSSIAQARPYLQRARELAASDSAKSNPWGLAWTQLFSFHEHWLQGEMGAALAEVDAAAQKISLQGGVQGDHLALFTAWAYLTLGQLKTAEELFQKIPSDQGALAFRHAYQIAIALAKKNDAALRNHAAAYLAKPRPAEVLTAMLLARSGLLSQAQKAIDLQKGLLSNSHLKITSGELALARGQNAQAVSQLREGLRLLQFGGSPEFFFGSESLADALARQGNIKEAIQVLKESTQQKAGAYPASGFFWLRNQWRLAQFHRELGQETEAQAIETELQKLLVYADSDHPIVSQLKVCARPSRERKRVGN